MCWHRWSKWASYEQEYGYIPDLPYEMLTGNRKPVDFAITRKRIRQRRTCEKCGRLQDRIAAELQGK